MTAPDTIPFQALELTFKQWLDLVDSEVIRITGVFDRENFRDWAFADAFNNGVEPVDAARLMLAADGTVGREFLAQAGFSPEEYDL